MRKPLPHNNSPWWPRFRSALLKASTVAALAFGGCNFSELEAPTWSPDLLVPTAHVRLGIEDLQAFDNLHFDIEATSSDIGIPVGTYNGLPELNLQSVGPFDFTLFEQIVDLSAARMDITAEVTNTLPLTIKEGVSVVFRNTADGTEVMTHTFEGPIPSGGTVDFTRLIEPVEINSDFRVYFENVRTASAQGTIEIKPNEGLEASINLSFEEVDRVRYKAGQRIEHSDTITYELGIGELEEVDPDGRFNIVLENFFPVEGGVQVYFLPKSRAYVLDSMFIDANEFEAPVINADGIVSESVSSTLEVPIDRERLLAIRPAKFIAIKTNVSSPEDGAEVLTADTDNFIDLRIIADLNVTVE